MSKSPCVARSSQPLSRRQFLGGAGAAVASTLLPVRAGAALRAARRSAPLALGYLMHLGTHFWADRDTPMWREYAPTDTLRCEPVFWREIVGTAAKAGVNMIVVDLLEGVRYRSHPELAIKGSWSPEMLREELARMRELGIEPIPKLNFSTAHDTWLGEYGRMVSTSVYYEVCSDLIAEAISLFDKPRFLHLGMDEETAEHQRDYAHATIRQHELWWHDLAFLVSEVEKAGVRAWVWSDYEWHHPELFYAHMPRSVLQSNWYYDDAFGPTVDRAKTYDNLDMRYYDQIPTGSNWHYPDNFVKTVEYCRDRVDPQRLKGFLQTTWVATVSAARHRHEGALAAVARARAAWDSRREDLKANS
jgi:hypothetical protein